MNVNCCLCGTAIETEGDWPVDDCDPTCMECDNRMGKNIVVGARVLEFSEFGPGCRGTVVGFDEESIAIVDLENEDGEAYLPVTLLTRFLS